ncbi:hypothetical protein ALC53_09392 [Atta colombica]|uniref:Uncharacterized protein n=1 Tax=Atta colombica TaxID=520822 RepID=A0A195B704_9HYME|nr:hypothetical protein ALC53_09392 [Atta colombica]
MCEIAVGALVAHERHAPPKLPGTLVRLVSPLYSTPPRFHPVYIVPPGARCSDGRRSIRHDRLEKTCRLIHFSTIFTFLFDCSADLTYTRQYQLHEIRLPGLCEGDREVKLVITK